jgi:2-dehydro-3-deoxygluconokinase
MSGPEILTFGESMISLRAETQVRLRGRYQSSVAGAESNVAIGLARLGHSVIWASALGEDEQGRLVSGTLLGEGVQVKARIDPERATGLMLRENRVGSRSRVMYYRQGSAASTLFPADVLPYLLPELKLVHVTGITPAISDQCVNTTLEVLTAAREKGILVSFDINYRSRLWSKELAAKTLLPILELCDVITGSEEEFEIFGDAAAEDIARGYLEKNASLVAIKKGAQGATLLTNSQSLAIAARSVEVRDTVGAGDAFCAGLLSGLIQELPLAQIGQLAAACGAFCVGNDGDWEGAPSRSDLSILDSDLGESIR